MTEALVVFTLPLLDEKSNDAVEWNMEYGDDWPLMRAQLLTLDSNRDTLVDLLETSDLVVKLFSNRVINGRQREFILSQLPQYEKNGALLDIIRKRSLSDYKCLVKCLRESNQGHIAQIFEKGGVFVKMRAAHPKPSAEISETEEEIIAKFTSLVDGKSPKEREELNRMLKESGIRISSVRKGQSIFFYIYCSILEELKRLQRMQISGEIATVLKRFLNQLLTSTPYSIVTVQNLEAVVVSCFVEVLHRSQIDEFIFTFSEVQAFQYQSYFAALAENLPRVETNENSSLEESSDEESISEESDEDEP